MSFFTRANSSDYKEYQTPDGEGYLRLRTELSKADMNQLYQDSPNSENDRRGVVSFSEKLAEKLIVDWSATDDEGAPVEFSVKEFRGLNAKAAQWIEKTIGEHFKEMTGAEVEDLEKKP